MTTAHVIHDPDTGLVHGISAARLAFEPRGAMLTYRDQLRTALAALPARPGEGLTATYLSPDVEFADVENVALYNLGTSCWAPLAEAGLVCGRGASFDGLHHLLYRAGPVTDPLPAWQTTLATVPATGPVGAVPRTAFGWWQLFRPRLHAPAAGGCVCGGECVADVRLDLPARMRLAGVVKPLLDGLVMALSCHDGSHADALRAPLAAYGDPDELWDLLCDPTNAPLGPRNLLRPRGGPAGFAVNPADERLTAFSIRHASATSQPSQATGLQVTIRRHS